MNNKTFEQITADIKAIGNNTRWMIELVEYTLTLWNEKPIIVTPPNYVELKVIDTDPGLKGEVIL